MRTKSLNIREFEPQPSAQINIQKMVEPLTLQLEALAASLNGQSTTCTAVPED